MKKAKLIFKVIFILFFWPYYSIYFFINYLSKKMPSKFKNINAKAISIGIYLILIFAIVSFSDFSEGKDTTKFDNTVSSLSTYKGTINSAAKNSTDSSNTSFRKSNSESSTTLNTSSSDTKSSSEKIESNNYNSILSTLIQYTNAQSAGPTNNYYWDNGSASLTGFDSMKPGDYNFSSDSQGRSSTAKAILTYSDYETSKGARQGTPLAPPSWPAENPKVAISYALTGRIYHGYLYNRSHSIADSLLGKPSYSSKYNFTTGTRPQNVGANQDGGMRHAEELAENFWKNHPNTNQVIYYETTPLYKDNETIPRGSMIDMKSSDNTLNAEVVVINSAEGFIINYNDGSATTTNNTKTTETSVTNSSIDNNSISQNTNNNWTIAEPGMVFVSKKGKYYSRVTNPQNYQYMSQSEADNAGYTRAKRGNENAQP